MWDIERQRCDLLQTVRREADGMILIMILTPRGFARSAAALLMLLTAALLSVPQSVSAQMDPKAVAGIPLPVSDVAVGTVVVRVIKGSLANNLPDQPVELVGAGAPRTVRTDASGRAEFTGLPPGARVSAVATVAGERLQSQEFAVPASGGTRLLLVATDPNAPASSGTGHCRRRFARRSRPNLARWCSAINHVSCSSSATAVFQCSTFCSSRIARPRR